MKARKARADKMVAILRNLYGEPKSELIFKEDYELLFAVILSAQCTDKRVNEVTEILYVRYPTLKSFANANLARLTADLSSISYYRTKARHIKETAQILLDKHRGAVPSAMEDLVALKGVARKTANVVRGELFGIWEGIAIDTHVKRFVRRFDLSSARSPDAMEKDLCALFKKEDWRYVNNGLVLYGRYVCPARKHDCATHPLSPIWKPSLSRWPKAD